MLYAGETLGVQRAATLLEALMQIGTTTWDQTDTEELAAVAKQSHPLMVIREIAQIKAALTAIQKRHPSDFILEAREEGILLGWLSFGKTSPTMGEMGRWQPHVLNVSAREEVFRILLRTLTAQAASRGIRRIEVGYGRVSEDILEAFDKRAAWLEEEVFHKLEDNLFLACTLTDHDLDVPSLPEGISIQPLSTVQPDDLLRCYRESFSESEHRQFFDFTPLQIREAFDGLFDLSLPYSEDASLVLVEDGQVIGFSLIRPRPEEVHLEIFGLHPTSRGRGLARTLLLKSMKTVLDQGTERITLGVDAVNVPAVTLYEKMGFRQVSRMIVHSWKQNG